MPSIPPNNTSGLYGIDNGATTINNDVVANAISANTLYVSNTITAGGNITAPYFIGNVVGNISGNLTVPGSNTQIIFNNNGVAGASADLTFDDATNTLTVSGQANVTTLGATGNVTANYFIGNGSQLTGLPSGYSNADVATFLANFGSNVLVTTGNVTSGNIIANGQFLSNLPGANVTGTVANATYALTANAATFAGTVTTAAQPNITSVGNLTGLTVTGNATAGNVYSAGNIEGLNLITNNSLFFGTDTPEEYIYADNLTMSFVTNNNTRLAVTSGNNINYNPVYVTTGNVTAGSGNVVASAGVFAATGNFTGNVAANYYFGNGSQLTGISTSLSGNLAGNLQGNGFGLANAAFVTATGNITGANLVTAGTVNATGNVSGNYFIGNGSQLTGITTSISGNLSGNLQGNGFGLANAAFVTATGNITANYFIGNGSQLTDVFATPGGSNTQVQFNDGGVLGGNANLIFNKTTRTLQSDNMTIYAGGNITFDPAPGNTTAQRFITIDYPATASSIRGIRIGPGAHSVNTATGGDIIAIGRNAGQSGQQDDSIAIGLAAGNLNQGSYSVAIGTVAGGNTQGGAAVAIGYQAGAITQGATAVAIGQDAGGNAQGTDSIAIGNQAGRVTQGSSAIAIGYGAGETSQPANSIILNANGTTALNATNSGFYVMPVRADSGNTANSVFYNATTRELTYDASYGNANVANYLPTFTGNVGAGNLVMTSSSGVAYVNNITGLAGAAVTISPDGTNDVQLNADTVRIGDNNTDATLITHGTGDLILSTHQGSASEGSIRIYDGAGGNIDIAANGSGVVNVTGTAGMRVSDGLIALGNITGGNISTTGVFTASNTTANLQVANLVVLNQQIQTTQARNTAAISSTVADPGRILTGAGYFGNISPVWDVNGWGRSGRWVVSDSWNQADTGQTASGQVTQVFVAGQANIANASTRMAASAVSLAIGGGTTANNWTSLSPFAINGQATSLQIGGGAINPAIGNTIVSACSAQQTFINSIVFSQLRTGHGYISGFNSVGSVGNAISFTSYAGGNPTFGSYGNVFVLYNPGTVDNFGVTNANIARRATNYYFCRNDDDMAQNKMGAMRLWHEFRYDHTTTTGAITLDKNNGQNQYLAVTGNITSITPSNFVTTVSDGVNTDQEMDTVVLWIQQDATGRTITLPTGSNYIYTGQTTTVPTTANSISRVSFTSIDQSGTKYLVNIQSSALLDYTQLSANYRATGNVTVATANVITATLTTASGSTVRNGFATLSSYAATGNVGNAVGFSTNYAIGSGTPYTGNVYAIYHPSNVNDIGVSTANAARSATNYYFIRNDDNVAQVKLGSLRTYHEYRYDTATSGNITVNKNDGQVQQIALTGNLTVDGFSNFVVSASDSVNTDYQIDTVRLMVKQGATAYTVTMPTGADYKYSAGNSTVPATANAVVMISVTGYDDTGTTKYLIDISPDYT